MRFDIDALFAHTARLRGDDPETETVWQFSLRSEDLSKLQRIGESMSSEFAVNLQEEVDTYEDGRWFKGPPLLEIEVQGVLEADAVKSLAARFSSLASAEGVTYDGVSCYDPVDEEELFGWLDLDKAIWRQRHYTDTGLAQGAPLPWVFGITAEDETVLRSAAAALEECGYSGTQLIQDNQADDEDVGDEDEGHCLVLRCDGRNDDEALSET